MSVEGGLGTRNNRGLVSCGGLNGWSEINSRQMEQTGYRSQPPKLEQSYEYKGAPGRHGRVAYNLADCLAKIDCPTVCDRVRESCSSDCLNSLRQGSIRPLHMAVRGGGTRSTIIGENGRQTGTQANGQTSHKQAQTSHCTKYGSSGVGYSDSYIWISPPHAHQWQCCSTHRARSQACSNPKSRSSQACGNDDCGTQPIICELDKYTVRFGFYQASREAIQATTAPFGHTRSLGVQIPRPPVLVTANNFVLCCWRTLSAMARRSSLLEHPIF
jgi:hypothetical protein